MATIQEFISKRFGLKAEDVAQAFQEFYSENLTFTTKTTEALWEKHNRPAVTPTGAGGKVTTDDIKRAVGEKTSDQVSPWSSPQAEKLAAENHLTPEDFPMATRTGHELKSGYKKVTLADVKAKLGKAIGKFSSKGMEEFAARVGLKAEDFPGLKTIKKADIEAKIASRVPNPFEQ